jgi:precorrin-8X/cobalt-precorrin-8 methylmutase
LTQVQNIRPEDIERESFRIIEQEFFSRTGRRQEEFSDREFAILQRVIHATGDFSWRSIRFHPQAIAAVGGHPDGPQCLRRVSMVAAGIGGKLSAAFGNGSDLPGREESRAARRAVERGRLPGDGEAKTSASSRSATPRPRSLPPSNWCARAFRRSSSRAGGVW